MYIKFESDGHTNLKFEETFGAAKVCIFFKTGISLFEHDILLLYLKV